MKLYATAIDRFFRAQQSIVQRWSTPPLKIHFSTFPALEPMIRKGFEWTQHELSFGSMTELGLQNKDVIVPLEIKTIIEFNNGHAANSSAMIPIPSTQSVNLLDDKQAFNAAMFNAGFSGYIPSQKKNAFPIIIKKRVGAFSESVFICKDDSDLKRHDQLTKDPAYFTQPFIPGPNEYATHIVVRDGKIRAHLNIKYTFKSNTPIKGVDKSTQHVCASKHLLVFEQMLNAAAFSGLCCVNYKEINGCPQVLEINPRFGGSLSRYFPNILNDLWRSKPE